jgi:hypothetical protein
VLEYVRVTGFPPSGPNHSGCLKGGDWLEFLLHGLIAGKHWLVKLPGPKSSWTLPPPSAFAYSQDERTELAGLFLMLAAYTCTDQHGHVCTTGYYHALEQTEKGQASARLGVAITSLLAWRFLDVPALHHVQPIVDWTNLPKGGKRPDFLGQDLGLAWHVFESKGTALDSAGHKVSEGKQQAAVVTSVLGGSPASRSVSVGLLRTSANPIHAHLEDPPPDNDQRLVLDDIDQAALEKRRYGPLARAMAGDAPRLDASLRDDLGARFFELPGVGYIGIAEPMASTIERYLDLDRDDTARATTFAEDIGRARVEVGTILRRAHRQADDSDGVLPASVELDGVVHEVAVSGDGIALAAGGRAKPPVRL